MTINTASSLGELIFQVQGYASCLNDEGADQRLLLYMIRDSAYRAMMEIDKAHLRAFNLERAKPAFNPLAESRPPKVAAPPQQFTIDDL